jgi:hypothetical protein
MKQLLLLVFTLLLGHTSRAQNTLTYIGALTATDQVIPGNHLFLNGIGASCGINKPYPGTSTGAGVHYDSYGLQANRGTCLTVTLVHNCAEAAPLMSCSAYIGRFNPNDLAQNYKADMGRLATSTTPASISFNVVGGDLITLVVSGITNVSTCSEYRLIVTGSEQLISAPAPDLVVVRPTTIPTGTYNSIIVTGSGSATLGGNVAVNTTTMVSSGGTLSDGCNVISGTGSFTLAAGGTFNICSAQGISSSGASGAVQTTGPRAFSPDASYVYNGTTPQSTGSGLPSQVRNLSTTNANDVTLTSPTSVAQVLTIGAAGNLVTNNATPLTLLSSSTGTALVVNSSTGVVSGNATVQRYIDPSLNPGLGYRHYSAPVSTTTVADLATSGFTPEVNAAYNAATAPTSVAPFPTVYGYDDSRLSLANNLAPFDKGFISPAALSDQLAVGRGYTVNIGARELVNFQGTLTTGDRSLSLTSTRPTYSDGGWQLLGNPYPAPLDYSLVAATDRQGLEGAIYVYHSTGPYVGNYRSYVNGIGNPVLPLGQGFFARVAAGQTTATMTFRNSQRLTTPNGTTFQRTAADPRPQMQLELRASTSPAESDTFYAYAESSATPAFDTQYDAGKLPNPTGLNLASVATSGEAMAIAGYPAFAATTVLPLTVGVPAAGAYTLEAAALTNLPTGLIAYLHDNQTGQAVPLVVGTLYNFNVTASQAAAVITGRFTLQFSPAATLATAASLRAAEVSVYPNPAHERFMVIVPAVAQATTVQAELLNTLGQVVRRQAAALPAAGTTLTVETADLATGVYSLHLQAAGNTLTKRVVVQ